MPDPNVPTTAASVATHGVLVTYRRPALLAEHLRRLASQTRPLASLTVVDNDADPAVKDLVEGPLGRPAASSVRYVAAPGNPGPAGGFTTGIAHVLRAGAADHDLVALLDDNDPPRTDTVLADTVAVYEHLRAAHPDVGGVGSWGANLTRRGRLRMATGTDPTPVDYLAGGGCPHYVAAGLRVVGGPDPALFFGFEELDLGRALHRAGWQIWSSGLARDHGWAETTEPTRARATVAPPTWRRYYSLRNLVVVLRRDGRWPGAVFVSLVAGVAKPLLNLGVRPRLAVANLRLNLRALRDGWTGPLGKTIDPAT